MIKDLDNRNIILIFVSTKTIRYETSSISRNVLPLHNHSICNRLHNNLERIMWHPNSSKHKATHGGYKGKPTKAQVTATLSFFSGVAPLPKTRTKKCGTQLNLFQNNLVDSEIMSIFD